MQKIKGNKKKKQQILATLVMGMNLVNSMAPMAVAMQKLPAEGEMQVQRQKSEAKPLEYTVLPHTLGFVESLILGKAEAAEYDIASGQTSSLAEMVSGDRMTISDGGRGTVSTMSGGTQWISGGTLTISTMSGGTQWISGGTGTGIVSAMDGGTQRIYSGGTGTVSTMSGGTQTISSGGTGTVSTMSRGANQHISSGGTGTVSTMSGGSQMIRRGIGTVSTMSGGTQTISSGGRGTVSTMSGGTQMISSGGIGTVSTMSAGYQMISSGGSGTVSTMNSGHQDVYDEGSGTVSTMNGGMQEISSGGIGTVSTMSAGAQMISSGGRGTVSTMSAGTQWILSGGSGTVSTMSAGIQWISSGGRGTVSTMSSGRQEISSEGTGTVSTMSSGIQMILSGGTGTVSIMNGGFQYINSGGSGTVSTMGSGYQTISSGGTGTVSTMSGGTQMISSVGTGTVSTMSGGTQNINGGTGTVSTMSGGSQNIYLGGSGTVSAMNSGFQIISSRGNGIIETMNDGRQYISAGGEGTISTMNGGTQVINVKGTSLDTVVYGGSQLIADGGTAKNTTINGGTAAMLGAGAIVEDVTMTGGEYLLGADGGRYHIGGKFEFTGGNFDMSKNIPGMTTATGTYETLTIDNLQKGGGTFIMDTDLASEANGDKINIINANAGTSYIQVNDASLLNGAVTDHKNLLLVTVDSGTATFVGKDLNNGGLWTVTPEIANGLDVTDAFGNVIGTADQWYLTHVVRAVNNDTQVLLEGNDNSYALWRNTNDTLRKRLGDLHYRSNEIDSDGIWARYVGGKFAGSGFDSSYNMYQLGYDKADNAKSTYGFALESGTGHADYSFGSGKDKLFAGSIYGTWTGDDGSYTDVVAKIGQFDTDIKSYGDYPDKASYKNRAYSVSVEYGKTIELNEKSGTFIEPQLQFIVGRLSSSEYTTDRGNNVYVGGLNSYIGRVGFVAGQKTPDGNDVYFKASALHEFGGSRDIHMAAANGETLSMSKDYSDTWFEVGIGTNIKLSKASYFYGDIERSFGGEIEKKWQVNAGVRFEF